MERVFFWVVAIILASTALVKFLGVGLPWAKAEWRDPVFDFLTQKQILLLAALVETLAMLVLWRSRDCILRLVTVLSVSTSFGAYRTALAAFAPETGCPCLGPAPGLLHLDSALVNEFMRFLLGFMLVASSGLLALRGIVALLRRRGRTSSTPAFIKRGCHDTMRTPQHHRLLWIPLGVLCAASALCDESSASFEVEGWIDHTYFGPNAAPASHSTNWFKVSVAGCRSKVRTGPMTDARIDFFEYCCEGTNSALLIKYLPVADTNVLNDATLILSAGMVPEYRYGLISPIWLAYASHCFYATASGGQTDSVFFMGSGFREHGLKIKSRWELSGSPPHLPSWMIDYSDGNRYSMQDTRFVVDRLAPPFDRPTTNVFYSVSGWSNVGGLQLPARWEVVRFRPNIPEQSLETESITRGFLQAASLGTMVTNFAPTFPLRTRITDKRLALLGIPLKQYTYSVFDGRIKTLEELGKLRNFQVHSVEANLAATRNQRRTVTLVAISALLFLPPLVALVWRKRRQGVSPTSPPP